MGSGARHDRVPERQTDVPLLPSPSSGALYAASRPMITAGDRSSPASDADCTGGSEARSWNVSTDDGPAGPTQTNPLYAASLPQA